MKMIISFKNIEHTDALDETIRKKTKKLEKYFDGLTEVYWTCCVEDSQQCADVKFIGSQFEYLASAKSDTLYKAFDIAITKIEKQVKKKKEKWKDHIHDKRGAGYKGSGDENDDGYGDKYVDKMFKE